MVTVADMHAATAYLGTPGHERPFQHHTRAGDGMSITKICVTSGSKGGRKEVATVPLERTLIYTGNTHLASGLAS